MESLIETLIVVNPFARRGGLARFWKKNEDEVLSIVGAKTSHVVMTTATEHGAGFVREALRAGAKRILVVGGDGSVSEALQGFFQDGQLIQPDAVLMVLPGGSGDDLFKTIAGKKFLSHKKAWARGLEILKEGEPQPADIGQIDWLDNSAPVPSRYFINIASFGFPGRTIQRVENHEGFWDNDTFEPGLWSHVLQGLASLLEYKPLTVQVRVDDQVFFQGKLHSGFLLNGSFHGGGIVWDSRARIDDGIFHLLIAKPIGWWTSIHYFYKIMQNPTVQLDKVHRTTGTKFEVFMVDESTQLPNGKIIPFFEGDGDLLRPPKESQGRCIGFKVLPKMIQLQMMKKK